MSKQTNQTRSSRRRTGQDRGRQTPLPTTAVLHRPPALGGVPPGEPELPAGGRHQRRRPVRAHARRHRGAHTPLHGGAARRHPDRAHRGHSGAGRRALDPAGLCPGHAQPEGLPAGGGGLCPPRGQGQRLHPPLPADLRRAPRAHQPPGRALHRRGGDRHPLARPDPPGACRALPAHPGAGPGAAGARGRGGPQRRGHQVGGRAGLERHQGADAAPARTSTSGCCPGSTPDRR